MTDIDLNELERTASRWRFVNDERGRHANDIIALIVRIRKLEAVAEAAERYAHIDIEDPALVAAYDHLIDTLAALDAKEEP